MENKKEIIRPYSLDIEESEIEKEKSDIISLTSSSSINSEEIECKKEIISKTNLSINDRFNSSDSTSYTDNLSYSSESSSLLLCNATHCNIQNKNYSYINYYEGVENYFKKIMPEKFYEYKKTKNYLPKNPIKEKNRNFFQKREEIIKTKDKKIQTNKFDNTFISFPNDIYYPMIGNIYFYPNNNFFFNYPFTNINNNEIKQNNESKNEKEKQIKNEINNHKNEDSNIYIIKKKEKQQKHNKNNSDENTRKENFNNHNKESNFARNKVRYNKYKKDNNNNYFYKKNYINMNYCDNYYK